MTCNDVSFKQSTKRVDIIKGIMRWYNMVEKVYGLVIYCQTALAHYLKVRKFNDKITPMQRIKYMYNTGAYGLNSLAYPYTSHQYDSVAAIVRVFQGS